MTTKAPAAPKMTTAQKEDAAANYQWSLTMLNSDPELKALFNQATTDKNGPWSAPRFGAALQNTKWFQTHSNNARLAQISRTVDPATYKASLATNSAALKAHAASMGAVLSDSQLAKITSDTTTLGWSQQQQTDALSSYVKLQASGANAGQYIGAAGQAAQALMATAHNNGYVLNDTDLGKWQQSIAAGNSTVDDYQQFMRRQAALTFPSFSDELLAGTDMKDLANPYINSMSNILEIPATNIDLQDPTIRSALAGSDPKTGKPQAMAMYQFENSLRQDPRWQYTSNAKQQAASTVLGIGRLMGVAG